MSRIIECGFCGWCGNCKKRAYKLRAKVKKAEEKGEVAAIPIRQFEKFVEESNRRWRERMEAIKEGVRKICMEEEDVKC